MTKTTTTTSLLLLLSLCLTLTAVCNTAWAQTTYNWTGNQNNNWDNGSNWKDASGWPDDPTHNARFDSANYGANNTDIDLRGGTFDILDLNMNQAREGLLFFSDSGTGTIRLHGDIKNNSDGPC